MTVLVTGAAGFIGAHLAAALARTGHRVVGCDAFGGDGPVAVRLQRDRVAALLEPAGVPCLPVDLADAHSVRALFEAVKPIRVVHLAARAGVRRSIEIPAAFVRANVVAFGHVLEACRRGEVEHLLFASSSSVYGARDDVPFRESDRADQPASLYAATKRAGELLAHAYAHVHRLPCTGLRFFTVYGPWGRPDMAYFEFAQRIRRGEPVTLYDGGRLRRDFTYVDDVVEAVRRLLEAPHAAGDAAVPHALFNVGNRTPVPVLDLVRGLEVALGREAVVRALPAAPTEVPVTCADTGLLGAFTGFAPATPLERGLRRFAGWLEGWDPLPAAGRRPGEDQGTMVR